MLSFECTLVHYASSGLGGPPRGQETRGPEPPDPEEGHT